MTLFKEILTHEVYPALGCTEPISCAFAAATAAAELGEPVEGIRLRVDNGTYKNGAAVTVPHSGGQKGNLIAAVLGALLARPDRKLEVLCAVTDAIRRRAAALVDSGVCTLTALEGGPGFRVEVELSSANHRALCVLAEGHTHVERVERDGVVLHESAVSGGGSLAYRDALKRLDFTGLLAMAGAIDDEDLGTLKKGVVMNMAMADRGTGLKGTASQLLRMKEDGYLADDVFFRTKIRVASAVDARMAGIERPVMTSGGSGNQGIVSTLTLHGVGRELNIPERKIFESIAVAHTINSYVKCFTGELAVICGCAMAAGVAAAAGLVYQQAGPDLGKITHAVNNVIGDLGGLICDGAKPGCAMKTVTSVDAAMRAGFMALGGYGLSADEGVVGRTVEDSISNLGRITLEGMFRVDPTVLDILREKTGGSGKA
jgi:L-cysteine desulfidase